MSIDWKILVYGAGEQLLCHLDYDSKESKHVVQKW